MRFEKVSFQEAAEATYKAVGWVNEGNLKCALENLSLPQRATAKSAGYDFYCPYDVVIKKGQSKAIPLLIKVVGMPRNVALFIFNRSGLSLRKGLRLDNSVGVIDGDYDQCIWFQATAETEDVIITQGDRICQGIFLNYLTGEEDRATAKRDGGFGSTGK